MSNPIVKQNIANAFEVVKLVVMSVVVGIVAIRSLGRMCSLLWLLVANAVSQVAPKSIANVFKTTKNVDLSVNAQIAAMASESMEILEEKRSANFNKPTLYCKLEGLSLYLFYISNTPWTVALKTKSMSLIYNLNTMSLVFKFDDFL